MSSELQEIKKKTASLSLKILEEISYMLISRPKLLFYPVPLLECLGLKVPAQQN